MKRTIISLLILSIPLAACIATEDADELGAGELGELNAPLLAASFGDDADDSMNGCGCPSDCVPTEEVCDGVDNDCDGLIDECGCPPVCVPAEDVCDGVDNDCDGLIDECGCPPACDDDDEDGVCDDDDWCPGTEVGEKTVPTIALGVNRFALVDDDFQFDTVLPQGQGPKKSYTTTDTGGCSCEQIIDNLGLGQGHTKFGCSISAMDDWVAIVNAD